MAIFPSAPVHTSIGSTGFRVENFQKQSVNLSDMLFGPRMRRWIFWFIVAFLAALTIKDVVLLVIDFVDNPTKADMNMKFNESMAMPNITFCMSRAQAWSHFNINVTDDWDAIVDEKLANMTDHDTFLKEPWDYRLVIEAYETIATLSSMERETTGPGSANSINSFRTLPRLAVKRELITKWLAVIAERKVSFSEFTDKTGMEVLRRSMQSFKRTTFNEELVIKTRTRISWISTMQICFQPWFDADNLKTIDDQGTFFVMLMSHNAETLADQQVECMTVDVHGRPSSLSRFMEGKGRAKDGFIDELCLGMRHEVTVEVRALYHMLENDKNGTACRDTQEGEDSEFDCRSRCRMEMIQEMCNCTAHTLAYLQRAHLFDQYPLCDYTKCELDIQRGNFTDQDCAKRCYRDCLQIRFEIDHETQGKMVRPDLTLVNLNWGAFEYLTLEQQWVWTFATFFAALGGSIGMWLGLSILSLIQGGTYLYSFLTEKVVEKRKETRLHGTTSGNNMKMNARRTAAANANESNDINEKRGGARARISPSASQNNVGNNKRDDNGDDVDGRATRLQIG